jgi:hypothetical protein
MAAAPSRSRKCIESVFDGAGAAGPKSAPLINRITCGINEIRRIGHADP